MAGESDDSPERVGSRAEPLGDFGVAVGNGRGAGRRDVKLVSAGGLQSNGV